MYALCRAFVSFILALPMVCVIASHLYLILHFLKQAEMGSLYRFDPTTILWESIRSINGSQNPSNRDHFSLTVTQPTQTGGGWQIWLFGGFSRDGKFLCKCPFPHKVVNNYHIFILQPIYPMTLYFEKLVCTNLPNSTRFVLLHN